MARCTATGSAGGAAERGYAMAALLVSLAAAGILMSAALPVWSHAARRAREAELVFRGEQYARAVELYQRVYAGAFPPDVETLVEERFLRRQYRDPMVEDGEFRIVHEAELDELLGAAPATDRPGEIAERSPPPADASPRRRRDTEGLGGIAGVVSRSNEASLRIYNGATRYSQWVFLHTAASAEPGRTPTTGLTGSERPPSVAEPGLRPGAIDR